MFVLFDKQLLSFFLNKVIEFKFQKSHDTSESFEEQNAEDNEKVTPSLLEERKTRLYIYIVS